MRDHRTPHHGRVLEQRVGELLLEALGGEGDVGLRHLPVVHGSAVPHYRGGRGREGVARLRELPAKPEHNKHTLGGEPLSESVCGCADVFVCVCVCVCAYVCIYVCLSWSKGVFVDAFQCVPASISLPH